MLKKIIRIKVYYDRGGNYFNYVKTLVLIAIAYKVFEDGTLGSWLNAHLVIIIPAIVIGYIFTRIVLGYYDKKYKIREYEIGEYNKTDPNLRQILRYLNDIKQKLNDNSADSEPPGEGGRPKQDG